ncbi:hypothetical protein KP509_28G044400 [Ceratopteris richardii]|uniref:Uncharacterized protein n=1 Tax=Ceratopteris richardii TaxID=49495 RepID=A0A8T2RBI3_CERRI|nr:hypothetical protein KP509_28G044400 [Ceratopteris richardii]
MGAGTSLKKIEALLLQEALELNLSFPESRLIRAIKHLVKEFGNSEDAAVWIRQDNFTVLVNYLLDDMDMNQEPLQPRSESVQATDEHVKKSETEHRDQDGMARISEKNKNGFIPCLDNSAVGDPCGITHRQKDLQQPRQARLDRQTLRMYYKEKLINSVRNIENASSCKVNRVEDSSIRTGHVIPGHHVDMSITNKEVRGSVHQAEHLLHTRAKVIPVQGSGNKLIKDEQSISRKRVQELIGNANAEPEENRQWKTRVLESNGCKDLATAQSGSQSESVNLGHSSTAGLRRSVGNTTTQAQLLQIEHVVNTPGGIKQLSNRDCSATERPHFPVDSDRLNGITVSSKITQNMKNGMGQKAELACTGSLSSTDAQEACCSNLNENCDQKGTDDACISYNFKNLVLDQLEECLKDGNRQRALEILRSWKAKGLQADLNQMEDGQLQGKVQNMVPDIPGRRKGFVVSYDISRGLEKVPISCVNEYNSQVLPENFLYVTRSVIRQAAHVDLSFSRIGDLHCCCSDDCLRSSEACKCTDSTRGEYAYDIDGRLIPRLAVNFVSGLSTVNGDFINECCDKCRCSMHCGNRIVQRGITKKVQVFMTCKKGWGVRALEKIPARSFLFEYLGEIATNSEQFERNLEYVQNGVFTYVMWLDADHDMEKKHFKDGLNDNEALVLDATLYGNVSRFVNHRRALI